VALNFTKIRPSTAMLWMRAAGGFLSVCSVSFALNSLSKTSNFDVMLASYATFTSVSFVTVSSKTVALMKPNGLRTLRTKV